VLGPVLVVSLWAGGVAVAAIWYGKEVGLTNNVGTSYHWFVERAGELMGSSTFECSRGFVTWYAIHLRTSVS
jgi:hypothetical protein